ncbi:ORF55 [Leucania separata nucleopolyhedrovirus]|uniref:ORF55 n=1 Tax=Leucania separata nucleopolyhedrovirus TaxID=1307956 RepID=Q0IL64_NPVLS|nr:ORF55 [Leucania separata nucleopolyhedrovirus]AAR28819.1 ORF55 [Leucania separata nucleopolyhedrovirus]
MDQLSSSFRKILLAPKLCTKHDFDIVEIIKSKEPLVYKEVCYLHSLGIPGILAGGFAAYVLGYTNEYSDVDFFCENRDAFEFLRTMDDRYGVGSGSKTFGILNHQRCNLQLVFIESLQFSGLPYYYELIRAFDIPVCQKGIFLKHPRLVRNSEQLTFGEPLTINLYHDTLWRCPKYMKRRVQRKLKYAKRTIEHGSPERLDSLCQGVLYENNPAYIPIRVSWVYYRKDPRSLWRRRDDDDDDVEDQDLFE